MFLLNFFCKFIYIYGNNLNVAKKDIHLFLWHKSCKAFYKISRVSSNNNY